MFHTNICQYLLQVCVSFIGTLETLYVSIMVGGYDMIEFMGGCEVKFIFFGKKWVFLGVRCWWLRVLLSSNSSLCVYLPHACLINKRQPETQTFFIQSAEY